MIDGRKLRYQDTKGAKCASNTNGRHQKTLFYMVTCAFLMIRKFWRLRIWDAETMIESLEEKQNRTFLLTKSCDLDILIVKQP